jgi:hypothetical protein
LEATGRVVHALETLNVDYLLVGSFSSNAYGIARATRDADFVIAYRSGILTELMEVLGSDFRLDPQMRFETITNSVRNVVTYLPTRFDIELFRLRDDPHHAERFERRCRRVIGELEREAWIPTAEDVIIQKLRWQRRRDVEDAKNVLAVQFDTLDWEYLRRWTTIHGTLDLLNQLRDELPDLNVLDDEP